MADRCCYYRCSKYVKEPRLSIRITLPTEPEMRFCSLTCAWSWLKDHVEEKGRLQDMSAVKGMSFERPPHESARHTPMKMTEATKTYAPGEFKFDLIPNTTEIPALLAKYIDGPYRFVHHAWVPYVRIGPATEQTPITVRAGEHLRLQGKTQSRTLRGMQQTMDLVILFEGGGTTLADVSTLPLKRTTAQRALDQIEAGRL